MRIFTLDEIMSWRDEAAAKQSEPLTLDMFADSEPDEAPIIDSIETHATYSIWFANANSRSHVPPAYGRKYEENWTGIKSLLAFADIGEINFKTQSKGTTCWIPARMVDPTPRQGTKDNIHREKNNVVAYTLMVIDVDEVPNGSSREFHEYLVGQGTTHLIHSTYGHGYVKDSHTKLATDDPKFERYRVVLPLSQECPVDEYKATIGAFIASLPEGLQAHDHASKSLSQLFWTPARRHETCPTIRYEHDGLRLDWTVLKPAQITTTASIRRVVTAVEDGIQPVTTTVRSSDKQPKVPAGKRNQVLHQTLHDYLRDSEVMPEWSDFKLTTMTISNGQFDPPLFPAEALKTAKSVYDTHLRDHPEKAVFYPARDIGEMECKETEWLIQDQVLCGHLTVIQGSPGVGKSTLFFHWAKILGDKQMVSLIGKPEDDDSTLKKRFMAAGAASGKVLVIDDRAMKELPYGIAYLRKQIEHYGAKLVFIDAVKSWMPTNMQKQGDGGLRECLEPLKDLAQELNVAIVISRHLTKDSNNVDAMARGDGGQAYTAVARCTLMVTGGAKAHPKYPDSALVSVVKCNFLSSLQTWEYPRLTQLVLLDNGKREPTPYFETCRLIEGLTADEILREVSPMHQASSRQGECSSVILGELEAVGGEMLSSVLKETVTETFPRITYDRALKDLRYGGKVRTTIRGANSTAAIIK